MFVVAAAVNAALVATDGVLTADVFLTGRGDCALTATASAVTMTEICNFKFLILNTEIVMREDAVTVRSNGIKFSRKRHKKHKNKN
jgi:hypothetical protein